VLRSCPASFLLSPKSTPCVSASLRAGNLIAAEGRAGAFVAQTAASAFERIIEFFRRLSCLPLLGAL
jgi:hypothetical protein